MQPAHRQRPGSDRPTRTTLTEFIEQVTGIRTGAGCEPPAGAGRRPAAALHRPAALLSRLKKGSEAAYEFLGHPSNPQVELSPIRLERTQLHIGDTLGFSADLTAVASAKQRANHVLSSPTKTGKRREKAYALKTTDAETGQTIALSKQHPLRSTATVTLLPGSCTLELHVNGRRFEPAEFQVTEG
ncbi:hypothetical protein [Streptomyces ipomoeae]|uniref:hypothetical protein n=1 Tax=Streptomyces ipomoeae TaxID=103232 RepID=UPI0011463118|nr:hypothetical protein [Streptomyces ipomoeae]MDX2935601.1 hypothetical protein [Streptomyces ipomoeae]TQE18407.1 hypothetical protein SipoB123_34265 [Streptomyces ipomoeae]